MVKLFKKIKDLILSKKVIDLDSDGKIESIKDEIQGLLSGFYEIKNKLEESDKKIDEVINEESMLIEYEKDALKRAVENCEKKIKNHNELINKAESQKELNSKIKNKVSEFIQ